jgi:pentapeptide MXKDX repeat protein
MFRPFRQAPIAPAAAISALVAIALVVAACTSPGSAPTASDASMAPESMAPESMAPHDSMAPESMAPESMAPHDSMAPESMAPESMAPEGMTGDGMAAHAALVHHPWATATLTDVATGKPFTIADFAGRTVFVEAMAIWCTNCRAQQGRFTEALGQIDPARVAYVVLTVDPSETADDLAAYRSGRGFSGTYAVAGRDVSAALKDEFGANVLNASTVPLITISPSGEISFATGGESAHSIIATVDA